MNPCEDHQNALSAYIDLELAPENHAEVARHIEQCPECAGLEHDLRALATEVGDETRRWQEPARSESMGSTDREPVVTRTWQRFAMMAAAAAVLIGVSWRLFFISAGPLANEEARRLLTSLEIDEASSLFIRTVDRRRTAVDATHDGSRWTYRISGGALIDPTDEPNSPGSALTWLRTMGIDALQRKEALESARLESRPEDPFDVVRATVSRNPADTSDPLEAILRFDSQTGKLLSMELGPFPSAGDRPGFAWLEVAPIPPGGARLHQLDPAELQALRELGYIGGD